MPQLPSREIPKNIRESNVLFNAVTDWFDDIWTHCVFPKIDGLYDLLNYKKIPDEFLDFRLYDLGFSSSTALSADSKRCILTNWEDIQERRHTPIGFNTYFGCILTNFGHSFRAVNPKLYIQPGSTTRGFGNATMLATAGMIGDRMTYIFDPNFVTSVDLHLLYTSDANSTKDLLNYIDSLIPLELPIFDASSEWKWYFYARQTGTVSVSSGVVTGTGQSWLTRLSGFKFIVINNIAYEIATITDDNHITLVDSPVNGTYSFALPDLVFYTT